MNNLCKKTKGKIVKKTWGSELWFENNEKYCGKILTCGKDWSSKGKFHYHKIKDETFFVLHGTLMLHLKETDNIIIETLLERGEAIRILPGQRHRFQGLPSCVFVEVSTNHNDEDSYRED